jgi:hypothetical protein
MSDFKKIWTFDEMYDKVRTDIDLEEDDPDEQFVTKDEFIGYLNEAITEAESEIIVLNQDYFLTYDYLPQVEGTSEYDMPRNIYLDKLRGVVFENGPERYLVKRFRSFHKFEEISMAEYNNENNIYKYFLVNTGPGQMVFKLIPSSRETAVVPPMPTPSTYIKRWYIRNANRIPYTGEYTNPEDILATAVSVAGNTITVDPLVTYVTGDAVKVSVTTGNTLPAPLVAGTVYYVIAVSSTSIKLATSSALAAAGTAIDLTTAGTGFFTLQVAATDAIIDATLVDIPECATFLMEWVKANCFFKDGDPRLSGSVAKLEQQRKMLQDTLAVREPDNDDTIQPDFSYYQEMS